MEAINQLMKSLLLLMEVIGWGMITLVVCLAAIVAYRLARMKW